MRLLKKCFLKNDIFLGPETRFGKHAGRGEGDQHGPPAQRKCAPGTRQIQDSEGNQARQHKEESRPVREPLNLHRNHLRQQTSEFIFRRDNSKQMQQISVWCFNENIKPFCVTIKTLLNQLLLFLVNFSPSLFYAI